MLMSPRNGCCLLLVCFASSALASRPVPLADNVDEALLPSGISALPVKLSGQLLYRFRDSVDKGDVSLS